MELEGKVALITGGGTGIGAAVAERFVGEGAKVCIAGRRREKLDEVAASLPSGTVAVCQGDITVDADVTRMISQTVEFGGRLDVVVNAAGVGGVGTVVDESRDNWRRLLDINLTGPFMIMQEAIPHMVTNGGGSIVNISSLAGVRSIPAGAAYSAAKAGLIQLTKQAALDYGREKVRCNVICPGPVRTSMMDEVLGGPCQALGCDVDEFLAEATAGLPLARYAQPHEIADGCLFLASERSSFVTGVALLIDGGTAIVDAYGAGMDAVLGKVMKVQ